nr:unnamed protein product [Callosobruchus analis]
MSSKVNFWKILVYLFMK